MDCVTVSVLTIEFEIDIQGPELARISPLDWQRKVSTTTQPRLSSVLPDMSADLELGGQGVTGLVSCTQRREL